MPMIRVSPSGPPIMGSANGDLLTWHTLTNEWLPTSETPYLLTEFDYIIRTRQDLVDVVAPVGGDFRLPTGSYFFKEAVALGDGERIVIDGTNVLMMGGGIYAGRGLQGNYADGVPWLVIEGGGSLYAYQMLFDATDGRHGVFVHDGSLLVASDCRIMSTATGDQAALQVGSWAIIRDSRIGNGIRAVYLADGGRLHMRDSQIAGNRGTYPLIDVAAGSEAEVQLERCRLLMSTPELEVAPIVKLVAPESVAVRFFSHDCYYYRSDSVCPCIELAGPSQGISLHCVSDRFVTDSEKANATQAVEVTGNVGDIILDDCDFSNVENALIRTAGLTANVRFTGNRLDAGCTNGVNWATASLPAGGLIESENQFAAVVTPFVGHAIVDALVMRRQNFVGGTGQAETVII